MSRPLIWWCTALAASGLLFLIVVWTQFDRIPLTVREPPDPLAQRDPYLALERLAAALGRPLTVTHDLAFLEHLPANGVLILGEDRARIATPERVARLLAWVNDGGHLVLPAGPPPADLLLRALKVRLANPKTAAGAGGAQAPRGDGVLVMRAAGSDRLLKAYVGPLDRPLVLEDGAAVRWSAGTAAGPSILHVERGRGAVTVVGPWAALTSNASLGVADNAAVVWVLLNLVHSRGPLVLMERVPVPTLWGWLLHSGVGLLASGAVLLAVWLGRIVPRFGPLIPDPVPQRRALIEHLRAMGRAVWRTNENEGLRYWVACVRRAVLVRACAIDPVLLRQTPLEQARAIAQRVAPSSGLDPRQIRTALAGSATETDGRIAREGFTQVIAILQKIETHL